MNIIEEVKQRQIQENLSDSRFSHKLGISRQMWEFTVTGKRQAGYKVWNAIITTYPDLTDAVLDIVEDKIRKQGRIKEVKGNDHRREAEANTSRVS